MHADLIYDLGAHTGEDSAFYLKKGFRVLAVEADPDLAAGLAVRFSREIEAQRLVLVDRAIAAAPGRLTFYKNTAKSFWSTLSPDFAAQRRSEGATSVEVTVEATTLPLLLAQHGTPYFIKIDIEGYDRVAMEGLAAASERPRHVSSELERDSFRELRRDVERLADMGYGAFKLSPQLRVPRQRAPRPAREGVYAEHAFAEGESGLFGEELPGRWMTASEVVEACRPIFLRYHLTGDDPLIRNKWLRRILKRTGFRAGWHDLHARLGQGA